MSPWQIAVGLAAGFAAGLISGAFGVGGGTLTTPVVRLLGGTAIQAVATPLPVIFPTALTGAYTYWRAGEISRRAIEWGAAPGIAGAIGGALLTQVIDPHWLLLVTAVLVGIESVRIGAGFGIKERPRGATPGWQYALAGGAAGIVSGLLGIGGGIVFVPIVTGLLGMPLKRALGTSLVMIAIIAVPGTLTHLVLGNINWEIFLVLVIGVVPGARIGALLALRARERSLRMAVAAFLFVVALVYGVFETVNIVQGTA